MKIGKWVIVVAAVAVVVFASAGVAVAQEAEAPAAESKSLFATMFSSFSSGLMFGALFAASIAGMALVIEHFINLRRDKLIPPELVGEIEALLEDEEYGEAMDLCDAEPTMLTSTIGAAIPKIEAGHDAMMAAVREAADEESLKLQMKVSWLSLLTAIAPMIGLLGTVTGMIAAFGVIASSPTPPKPAQLADGIQTALLTTAFGLMIAIPCMISYFFFRSKCNKFALENAAICVDLVERIRPAE